MNEIKMRGVRVETPLWEAVKKQAKENDRTVGLHVIHILKKAVASNKR
jgi:hypothetical protein